MNSSTFPSSIRVVPIPKVQYTIIKNFLNTELTTGKLWFPVHIKWYNAWKSYCAHETEDILEPGPITNESLTVTVGNDGKMCDIELSKDIQEGEDFILVPESAYTQLEKWYGGGPRLPRSVVESSTIRGGKSFSVDLYPEPVMWAVCGVNGQPVETSWRSQLFSRRLTIGQIQSEILRKLTDLTSKQKSRFSIRINSSLDVNMNGTSIEGVRETVVSGNIEQMDVDQKDSYDDNADQKLSRCTNGENSKTEEWKALTVNDLKMTLDSFLTAGDKVELLVEFADILTGQYPRHAIVESWRNTLQVGNRVDAMDNDNKWYPSVIKDINVENKEALIHFEGWASKWDLARSLIDSRIQPLYSQTINWKIDLALGSRVDIRMLHSPDQDEYRWHQGIIKEFDNDAKNVRVEYIGKEPTQDRWVPLDSEEIMPIGSHTKVETLKTSMANELKEVEAKKHISASKWAERDLVVGIPKEPGAVGLSNLGNTCFMNSMLQCLISTEALTSYFLTEDWEKDVNEDNVLGANGKMAHAYAELVRQMWSGKYTCITPRALKQVIGQHAPAFAGYQQQDSQELMIFLLDGLHEDLNRIRKKPYVKTIELKGKPDADVAQESWRCYLMRNDSVLVEKVHGLLKSHVTCPTCSYESITFDAYTCLSLPIPVDSNRVLEITYVPLPYGSTPLKISATLPQDADIKALKLWLQENLEHKPSASSLAVMDIFQNRIYKTLHDRQALTDIKDSDTTLVCELEFEPPSEHIRIGPVFGPELLGHSSGQLDHPSVSVFDIQFLRYKSQNQYISEFVSLPMKISVLAGATNSMVHEIIQKHIARFFTAPPEILGVVEEMYDIDDDMYGAGEEISEIEASADMDFSQSNAVPALFSESEQAKHLEARVGYQNALVPYVGNDHLIGSYSMETEDLARMVDSSVPEPFYRIYVTGSDGQAKAGSVKREIMMDENPFVSPISGSVLTVEFSSSGYAMINSNADYYEEHVSRKEARAAAYEKKVIKLEECFTKFLEQEQLGEDNQWYCSSCKEHRQAFKKFDIWTTPDVLILHLKRFQYQPTQYMLHRRKIDAHVEFPIENLDLTNFMTRCNAPISSAAPPIYDLFAVSEHSGTLRGGHYTATAKNFKSGNWCTFNDGYVSNSYVSQIVSPQAYVLFYKRKVGSLLCGGLSKM